MTILGSDEQPSPAQALNEALVEFTGCIGNAVPDICSYSLTIGEDYVPFDPDPGDDCEDDDAACSQIWVRVSNVSVISVGEGWDHGGCGGELQLSLEVGVLRCFGITEQGAAPTATEVLVAATDAMDDMKAIYCAAMDCEVWTKITAGEWLPEGPLGGQVGGRWTFTVVI